MPPVKDRLVDESAIADYLGLKVAPREFGVSILIVNWNNRRLLDRDDVLRWLRVNAESLGGSAIVERLHDELAEITAEGN